MFSTRWHHGLHWERDLPEELTAGREDVHLRFSYRTWGARPGAISEEAQLEYLRAYRHPGAMRAGFELYRATPRDVADNEAFLAQGGKPRMPFSATADRWGAGAAWRPSSLAARGGGRARRDRRGLRPLDPGGAAGLDACAAPRLLRRRAELSTAPGRRGAETPRVHSRALEAPDRGRALRRGRVLGRRRRPAPPLGRT